MVINVKRLISAVMLLLITISLSSCKTAGREFITGKLKNASDLNVSFQSQYEKDGVRIHEVYMDNHVLSFIIDFSSITDFNGGFLFVDSENFQAKYHNAFKLQGQVFHVNYPNYDINDKLIIGSTTKVDDKIVGDIEINLKDICPSVTTQVETVYSSGTEFLYKDENYKVDSLIQTDCFYILKFDRNFTDPGYIAQNDTKFSFYDKELENRSSFFINDYTLYLYDPLFIDDTLYLKIDNEADIFALNFKKT